MELTYKIITRGYRIYNGGQLWIEQGDISGGYFPYPVYKKDGKTIDLAKSAEAHIEALKKEQETE